MSPSKWDSAYAAHSYLSAMGISEDWKKETKEINHQTEDKLAKSSIKVPRR